MWEREREGETDRLPRRVNWITCVLNHKSVRMFRFISGTNLVLDEKGNKRHPENNQIIVQIGRVEGVGISGSLACLPGTPQYVNVCRTHTHTLVFESIIDLFT